MRKTILLLLVLGLSGGAAFTSCDDDNNGNAPVIDPVIYTADFTGSAETTLDSGKGEMTFPATPGQKVIFTRDTLDRCVLIYKDWTGMGTNYGDFSIPVSFTGRENSGLTELTVSGEGNQILYKEGRGYEATLGVTGKIFCHAIVGEEGRKDSCSLLITVNMPVAPTMTLDFKLVYTGVTE